MGFIKKRIVDIAKELNLSPSTISKIVNNTGRISLETRERVLKYVHEAGYVAMSNARVLSSKKSWRIGVVYSDISLIGFEHPFFSRILQSFKSYVEQIGYEIIMIVSKLGENELTYVQWCENKQVDGALIVMGNINNPNINGLVNSDFPIISTDIIMPKLQSVISNDYMGVDLMIDYALSKQYKDVVCVSGPVTARSFQMRTERFVERVRKDNLNQDMNFYETKGFGFDSGFNIVSDILSRPKLPQLLIVFSDVLAFGIIRGLEKSGYKVPDDLELIGYDDIDFSKNFYPELSTVRQNTYLIGTTAAKKLISKIDKSEKNVQSVTYIPVELIHRQTTKK